MINFVQNEKQENPKFVALRRKVVKATTVVLVVYVAVLAGFLGWWGYLSIKEKRLTAEEVVLQKQIVGLSEKELLIRRLYSRGSFAKGFLNLQDNVSKHVAIASGLGVDIVRWSYTLGGKQTIEVNVESSARAEQVVASLLQAYLDVSLVRLDRNVGGTGFVAVVDYGGPK